MKTGKVLTVTVALAILCGPEVARDASSLENNTVAVSR